MAELLTHDVQEAMFEKAFYYVREKHGEVNLQTCLSEMYNKDLDEDYVVCICLACISLIEKGSEDFEKIQEGLTQKMKKSIMKQVGEHLEKSSSSHVIGTPEYLAPEVLIKGERYQESYIWSFGLTLYEMLVGYLPWEYSTLEYMLEIIETTSLKIETANMLFQKMVCKDYKERITTKNMFKHKFFEDIDWNKVENKKYPPPYILQI